MSVIVSRSTPPYDDHVTEDTTTDIDELLAEQVEPSRRPRSQYVTLGFGVVAAVGVAAFLLLGVLPVVAGAVASVLSFILRLLAGT